MILKLILVTPELGALHYWDRAMTGWLSGRKMRLSGMTGLGASNLVSTEAEL